MKILIIKINVNSSTTKPHEQLGSMIFILSVFTVPTYQPKSQVCLFCFQGQRFVGDLLADGKIRSQETDIVFITPSAWAVNCRRIINPVKKSGCGWASVRLSLCFRCIFYTTLQDSNFDSIYHFRFGTREEN